MPYAPAGRSPPRRSPEPRHPKQTAIFSYRSLHSFLFWDLVWHSQLAKGYTSTPRNFQENPLAGRMAAIGKGRVKIEMVVVAAGGVEGGLAIRRRRKRRQARRTPKKAKKRSEDRPLQRGGR